MVFLFVCFSYFSLIFLFSFFLILLMMLMFSFVGGYYKDKDQIQRNWKMGGIGGARYGISKTNKNYVKNIQQIFHHNHLESR